SERMITWLSSRRLGRNRILLGINDFPEARSIEVDDIADYPDLSGQTAYGRLPGVFLRSAEHRYGAASAGDRNAFPTPLHLIEKGETFGFELGCAHHPCAHGKSMITA